MVNTFHMLSLSCKSISLFEFTVVYKIRITAGLTSIREVVALSSSTRIAYKLNKETF